MMTKDTHPSTKYVHSSIRLENTKNCTCDTDALENSDIFEHYVHLFIGVEEVPNTGSNHDLETSVQIM